MTSFSEEITDLWGIGLVELVIENQYDVQSLFLKKWRAIFPL
jgi:hypothetical protein